MSDVTNAKKVVKLVVDLVKTGLAISADGKFDGQDVMPLVTVAQEIISDLPAFKLAASELQALDTAGAEALVSELAADLTLPSAKVQAVVQAVASFVPCVVQLIQALKLP